MTKQKWDYLVTRMKTFDTPMQLLRQLRKWDTLPTSSSLIQRHKTMKTVNAIVLKEEMDRKKADKQSMTRQEKLEYVNNWKKENKIFLCDTLGLEDGPQYKFLMGIFISPSTSKNQVPFLQEVLQADATHMSFWETHTIFSVFNHCKWYYVGTRICHVVWQ